MSLHAEFRMNRRPGTAQRRADDIFVQAYDARHSRPGYIPIFCNLWTSDDAAQRHLTLKGLTLTDTTLQTVDMNCCWRHWQNSE